MMLFRKGRIGKIKKDRTELFLENQTLSNEPKKSRIFLVDVSGSDLLSALSWN